MTGEKNTSAASIDEPEEGAARVEEAAPESAIEAGNGSAPVAEEPSSAEMKDQLAEALRKAESHWENLLRARAEIENLRKRSERDLENAHKYGLERLVSELLPVKDSLELGLAAGAEESEESAKNEKMREGVELTLKMLSTALEKFGVTELNPEGEAFNPEFHQAMTVQETEGHDPHTVVSVIQKGYLLNDRLIRPALVIVAK